MLPGHCGKSISDDLEVNKLGVEQRCHEVLILFSEGTELGDAQVLFVQAPPGELGFPGGRGGVRVLNLDQAVAPAIWQNGRCVVDSVDAEAVLLFERGPLACDTIQQVSKALDLVVVFDEREYVDLNRHGGFSREFVFGEVSEDGLGPDDDHLWLPDDLAAR